MFQRHLSVVSKKQVKKDGSIIHTAINIYFVRGREASIWKSLSAKEASQGGQREEEIVCMSVCVWDKQPHTHTDKQPREWLMEQPAFVE